MREHEEKKFVTYADAALARCTESGFVYSKDDERTKALNTFKPDEMIAGLLAKMVIHFERSKNIAKHVAEKALEDEYHRRFEFFMRGVAFVAGRTPTFSEEMWLWQYAEDQYASPGRAWCSDERYSKGPTYSHFERECFYPRKCGRSKVARWWREIERKLEAD